MVRFFTILFLIVFSINNGTSQGVNGIPIDQATINRELSRRGLTEGEVRAKLEDRGIDLDNVNTSQLPQLEAALEEIEKEIRADKEVQRAAKEVAQDASEEIIESVEDGATVEEAIAEELVEQTQERLPGSRIYGQQIFRDKSLKVFSQSKDVKPSPHYILGPGDKINVSIWGMSQEDASYTINQEGYIKPSGMSKISLKGISYKAAKKLLKSRFAQFYQFRPEEFEATITYARTLTINIYGEVFNPGGYTLPATNTAFNALVACGGPVNIGSVRNIKLMRENGVVDSIDVYKFMTDPTIQKNYLLNNNDVIFVSLAKKIVDIRGAVIRPMKYELLPNEELKQLIDYAGGLSVSAYTKIVKVKRYENNEEKIIDLKLSDLLKSSNDFKLKNGDIVTIPNLPKSYDNVVLVDGAVELGGEYELEPGMRVTDLIKKGMLAEDARKDVAFLISVRDDGTASYERINIGDLESNPSSVLNFKLKKRDRLVILSKKSYVDKYVVTTSGHLRSPKDLVYDPAESIRVADAILLSGGLKPGATDFAYIRRYDPKFDKHVEYIRINLMNALADATSGDNQVLQPNDRLIVYSKGRFLEKSTVSIRGAVKSPGEFTYDKSLTLTDALTLAGGFTLAAAKNRVDVFRVEIVDNKPVKTIVATLESNDDFKVDGGDFELEPYDQIIVRRVPNFKLQQLVTIAGEVEYPGPYALLEDNEKLSSIVSRAGGLTNEAFPEGAKLFRNSEKGYIVMDLDEALLNTKSNANLILKPGDKLEIPTRKDLVGVLVANTKALEIYPEKMLKEGRINVPFEGGKSAKYYVNRYAAGFGENAKRSSVAVEHPSGEIERTRNFLFFRKYPKLKEGSVITVGRKSEKKQKERKERRSEPVNWGKVVSNSIAQVTAVLTLILLVQRLD